MADCAQGDEIAVRIVAQLASLNEMMDLQFLR